MASNGTATRTTETGTAADRAYATLRTSIIEGTLAPGSPLAEVDQSTRLGMSRTPVREAFARLIDDGLATELGPRTLVVSTIDADDVTALFDLRRALDEQSARLAARRATHEQREHFRTIAERFHVVTAASLADDDSGRHGYYTLVTEFDAAIDAALGRSPHLATALGRVRTHLARVRRLAHDDDARLVASASEHGAIADAIADGDAERAAHATHLHLHNALTSIHEHLALRQKETP
ncbi:MAG: GntR family transcriptional regulator [Microcella sp.]